MAERATLAEVLADVVSGEVRAHEAMSRHTTLKVGGPAAAWVRAEAPADLVAIDRACTDQGVPWLITGRGSNLLVADAGWPGAVVVLGRGFRGVSVDGRDVRAGAAEPMPVLARAIGSAGLGGAAFGIAIPGTLGGAVRMNAGAHGTELGDVLVSASVVRPAEGPEVHVVAAADLDLGYRTSAIRADEVVVGAHLRLTPADAGAVAAEMDELRAWRRAHQPIGEPSCGSVFTNPPGDSAGRLIDAAGCKGLRAGGATVSARHANFITVTPGAAAGDVHALIVAVAERVRAAHGIDLHPEVVIVGFDDHLAMEAS